MMTQFGCGAVLVRPTTIGNSATPSGPGQFLTVQDVGVEASVQLVPLKGQSQYPDDVAPGDKELKGTGTTGRYDPYYFNSFMFGDTLTVANTTATQLSVDESGTIPGTSPYTVVGSHTTAVADLGVRYSATNQPLQYVASGPATGQYSVGISTGTITYTFAAADEGLGVIVSYSYTATADSLQMVNHPMGYGPTNEMFLQFQYKGVIDSTGKNLLHLYNVRFSNWGMPEKRDGWMMSKFDFMAYPNAAGQIGEWITGNL